MVPGCVRAAVLDGSPASTPQTPQCWGRSTDIRTHTHSDLAPEKPPGLGEVTGRGSVFSGEILGMAPASACVRIRATILLGLRREWASLKGCPQCVWKGGHCPATCTGSRPACGTLAPLLTPRGLLIHLAAPCCPLTRLSPSLSLPLPIGFSSAPGLIQSRHRIIPINF